MSDEFLPLEMQPPDDVNQIFGMSKTKLPHKTSTVASWLTILCHRPSIVVMVPKPQNTLVTVFDGLEMKLHCQDLVVKI